MHWNDYQFWALSKMKQTVRRDKWQLMLNGALGLCGEAGEFADTVKKIAHHDHPLTPAVRQAMILELGDVLFYVATAAESLGVPLSEVMSLNIDKLNRRYPNGFEAQRSQDPNRDGDAADATAYNFQSALNRLPEPQRRKLFEGDWSLSTETGDDLQRAHDRIREMEATGQVKRPRLNMTGAELWQMELDLIEQAMEHDRRHGVYRSPEQSVAAYLVHTTLSTAPQRGTPTAEPQNKVEPPMVPFTMDEIDRREGLKPMTITRTVTSEAEPGALGIGTQYTDEDYKNGYPIGRRVRRPWDTPAGWVGRRNQVAADEQTEEAVSADAKPETTGENGNTLDAASGDANADM